MSYDYEFEGNSAYYDDEKEYDGGSYPTPPRFFDSLDFPSVFDSAPFDWGDQRQTTTTTSTTTTTKSKTTAKNYRGHKNFYVPPNPTTTKVRSRPLPPVVEYLDERKVRDGYYDQIPLVIAPL